MKKEREEAKMGQVKNTTLVGTGIGGLKLKQQRE